jgi:hypothetical protein
MTDTPKQFRYNISSSQSNTSIGIFCLDIPWSVSHFDSWQIFFCQGLDFFEQLCWKVENSSPFIVWFYLLGKQIIALMKNLVQKEDNK